MRFLPLIFLFLATFAFAQYDGPAVESCRALPPREMARERPGRKDIVLERDQALPIARFTRKLGNQFVSSILRGNGAVVLENAPSAELAFICLLADDKRALFFEWLPRPNAPALAQCTREAGVREQPRPCLQTLLQVAENDLMQSYALTFQEARERDHAAGNERTADIFRKANDEWRQYRDAECARRRDNAPKGVSPEDLHVACLVELTRRRGLDMR